MLDAPGPSPPHCRNSQAPRAPKTRFHGSSASRLLRTPAPRLIRSSAPKLLAWLCIVPLSLLLSFQGASGQRAKELRNKAAEKYVHASSSTLPRPEGEGIRPRSGYRRDEDSGFGDKLNRHGRYSVKIKRSALKNELSKALKVADKWKARAEEYKAKLKSRNRSSGDYSSTKAFQKAKEQERRWRQRAIRYKRQIQTDASRASQAASQLQDALRDMKGGKQTDTKTPKCDESGCWAIDTSDATTRATLKKFRDAATGRPSTPMDKVTRAANEAVAATAADVATINSISKDMHAKQWAVQKEGQVWKSGSSHQFSSLHPRRQKCRIPTRVLSAGQTCRWIKSRCSGGGGLFNYMNLTYCAFPNLQPLAVLIMVVWLVALAVWLGLAADKFLCPCLTVVSKICRMSENVAGVTFLAFGNGAPDIFSQVAATVATSRGGEMGLGEIIGSSLMVSGVVLGVVAIATPFTFVAHEFLRDIAFFLGSLLWLFIILLDSAISLWESAGFIVLYGMYLYSVLYGGDFFQHLLGSSEKPQPVKHDLNQVSSLTEAEAQREGKGLRASGSGLDWRELAQYLNPFADEDFDSRSMSVFAKFLSGLRAPGVIVMKLTCPVVDEEQKQLGWNKSAVIIQTSLFPVLMVWCVILHGGLNLSPANVYLAYSTALVLGAMGSMAVNASSSKSFAPKWFRAYSFVGFVTSVAWIYVLAAEVVNVLQAFGVVLGVSETILGLTVLAFANSIGDLVANLAMAKAGMPGMAAAACLGAPLLNLLLGAGSATFLGNLLVESPYPFELNMQLYVSLLFLIFTLIALLVYALYNKMKAGKMLGVILILIYVASVVTCLGLEAWGGKKLLTQNVGRKMQALA